MKTKRLFPAVLLALLVGVLAAVIAWRFGWLASHFGTGNSAVTKIREDTFGLDLPGQWNADGDSASAQGRQWIYTAVNQGAARGTVERVVVSIVLTDPMNEAGQHAVLEKYLAWRVKAEKAFASAGGAATAPGVTLGEITRNEKDGIVSARYEGFDAAADRRFACLVLVSSHAAGVFSVEGVKEGEQAFGARSRGTLDSAVLLTPAKTPASSAP